jgi:hypothetical protein
MIIYMPILIFHSITEWITLKFGLYSLPSNNINDFVFAKYLFAISMPIQLHSCLAFVDLEELQTTEAEDV